jgi:histidinol phosphatase-like enzyme (inositol monophosphatase family)
MPRVSPEELRQFAVAVAAEAGELTMRYFRTDLDVDTKEDDTPVTRADREAEQFIRSAIRREFPHDDILGEEYGIDAARGDRTWVVDPIDGTKSFVAGVPLYAVLVAVLDGRFAGEETETARVLTGVIHIPPLGETISAGRGGPALHTGNGPGREAVVSGHGTLRGARVTTSDYADLRRREPAISDALTREAGITRTWGDAFGYLLVATGRMEAMIDPIVSPWDIAGLPVIIEGAGGRYSDLAGRSVITDSAVATNGLVHDELLGHRRD